MGRIEIPPSEFSNPYSKHFDLSKARELYLKASIAQQAAEGNVSSVGQIMQELWKDNIGATLKELGEKNEEWQKSVDEIKEKLKREDALKEAGEIMENGYELPLISSNENDELEEWFYRVYYHNVNDVFYEIFFKKKKTAGEREAERKITDHYGHSEMIKKKWPIYEPRVVDAEISIMSLGSVLYRAGEQNITKEKLLKAMREMSSNASLVEFEYPGYD